MSEQPAEQPAGGPVDPFAGLDVVSLECDLKRGQVSCHNEATYTATLHYCANKKVVPVGQNVLICEKDLNDFIQTVVPSKCAACNHKFGSFIEIIWNIQRLGGGEHGI